MSKDIKPYNDKNREHGFHEVYYTKSDLSYQCYYVNGDWVGYCVDYYNNIQGITYYIR